VHMRIGIDGRALMGRRTGVGRYTFELCQHLSRFLPEARFFVYSPSALDVDLGRNWSVRTDSGLLARSMKPIAWLKTRCGRLCREDELDVFWGCATFLPTLPPNVKKVITVYDLTFQVAPSTMTLTHWLAYRIYFRRDVLAASKIIVISEGTAQRLKEFAGRSPDAIIRPAVDAVFQRSTPQAVAHLSMRLGIRKPYLLAVATWEPRKNLETLIQSFAMMKASGELPGFTLVLAGGRGWKDQRLKDLLKDIPAEQVRAVGFVSDEELAILYSGAEAFVFPSIYEGYGIPVAEALRCGSRVVAADLPEVREAGGETPVYVTPDRNGIMQGIRTALAAPAPVMTHDDGEGWEPAAERLADVLRRVD
jgi:glycosyltransferase involved in cell wall biosynthesis